MTDSSAGGRMIYLATVEISLRDNDNLVMIKNLFSGLVENKAMNLFIRTTDFNGKISEERFYQGAAVQEIVFPELNGAGKNTVNVQVKIRAGGLSVKENPGTVNSGLGKRPAIALESNYRMTLGGLPANRIARISALRITAGQSASFSLDVSEPDAKAWQNWLLTAASKREAGSIEWLTPTLKEVVFRIDLKDVEITSASSQYSSATEGRVIARLGVGLRAKVAIAAK